MSFYHRHAYSLVELVVVLTILAIVAAIAMPRYSNAVERVQLEQAVQHVRREIELAQCYARLKSKSVSVAFDTVSNSVTILE